MGINNREYRHTLTRIVLYFLLALSVPGVLILLSLPSYYRSVLARENKQLMENIQDHIVRSVDSYMFNLKRLGLSPLFNGEFDDALLTVSLDSFADMDAYRQREIRRDIADILYNQLLLSQNEIQNIVLYMPDEELIMLDRNGDISYSFDDPGDIWWVAEAREAERTPYFSRPHIPLYSRTGSPVVSVLHTIRTYSGRFRGIIKTDIPTSSFGSLFDESSFQVETRFLIEDSQGQIIYPGHRIDPPRYLVGNEAFFGGDRYYFRKQETELGGWNVVVLRNRAQVLNNDVLLYVSVFVYVIFQISVTIFLFNAFSRSLKNSFEELEKAMHAYGAGDLSVRYRSGRSDPVSDLGGTFNLMAEKIDRMIVREYHTQTLLKTAEFNALQSQVQPHFLYNIFGSLLGLNALGDKVAMKRVILSMRDLLQYTVYHGDDSTVEEEFAFLDNYCHLHKLLMEERLTFSLEYDPDLKRFPLPKLLLQPLVENSIKHGIEEKIEGGILTVRARKRGGEIQIEVADDGRGFEPEAELSGGIGIQNVRERVKMTWPDGSLDIISARGEGAIIRLSIPGVKT